MGDVIRTTPLIAAYRKKFPDCHISWLTLTPEILPSSEIDSIYKWDVGSVFILSNRKFDIAINLDKEDEACMLLSKLEATEKYGFIWNDNHIEAATPAAMHKLVTGLFDHISQDNTQHYMQEIFDISHLPFNDEEYLINLNEKLAQQWAMHFETISGGKKIIGLNTGCGNRWLTRLWPDEYWITLINQLLRQGFFPVVLGGPQENDKNTMLSEKTGCYYPGTFSLEEFIALSKSLDLVVTQVSMMMHIAMALKRKIVLMNNIFNKHEFYMYNRGIIVEPESGCDCYYGNSCSRERSCMYDLKPEIILKKIKELL